MTDRTLLDGDGYPTDETVALIEDFVGTPHEFFDLIEAAWSGPIKVTDEVDWFGRPCKRLYLATGGWSGNETIVSTLHESMFWFAFWQMSQRGGAYTFDVRTTAWDTWQLSRLRPKPAADKIAEPDHD